MKALALNGSSRENGNTSLIIRTIFDIFSHNAIDSEAISLSTSEINPCKACFACKGQQRCVRIDDDFGTIFEKMKASDIIILGSPVYSADISAKMKLLLDRAAVVVATNPGLFRHKIGASVAAVRRAGAMTAIDTMNHFFLNKEMIIVGSTYWNMVYGNKIGEIFDDQEGMANIHNLAENISWLLGQIHKR